LPSGVIAMTEDLPRRAASAAPGGPDGGTSGDAGLDGARLTASAAKARRVVNSDGEPGVLDLTPLRELLAEVAAELGKVGLREQIARALRQAADIIDPPAGQH